MGGVSLISSLFSNLISSGPEQSAAPAPTPAPLPSAKASKTDKLEGDTDRQQAVSKVRRGRGKSRRGSTFIGSSSAAKKTLLGE